MEAASPAYLPMNILLSPQVIALPAQHPNKILFSAFVPLKLHPEQVLLANKLPCASASSPAEGRLVKQEPSLEEMQIAYTSYIAHFDHIPSAFAYVKHFNRFRSGIMPNKKGTTLKKLEQQQADLKMEQWIKQMEDQNEV